MKVAHETDKLKIWKS